MSASVSLIPELEDVIQHGSQDKRAATVKRIANLFIDGAPHFNEDHIGLFDDVLCRLIVEIETKARAEMAQTLAPMNNAPMELMRKLAHDDDIAVAGPVLTQSARLKETELVELAKTKGQAHLAAIAGRAGIGEAVTDVLVRRGDAEVMHNVADNQTARLSEGGFSALVKRAEGDGDLAEKVGQRPDIPAHLFRDLLVRATAVVQQRLLQAAKPETRNEIQRVLEKVSKEFNNSSPVRDYAAAQRAVLALHQTGSLGEPELAEFAKDKKFEETVASLSLLCGVPIETLPETCFRLPTGMDVQFGLPAFLAKALKSHLTSYPAPEMNTCVLCGVCRDACPPAAITIQYSALSVDNARCIRCWCCRELCPHGAMQIKRGLLLRSLVLLSGTKTI